MIPSMAVDPAVLREITAIASIRSVDPDLYQMFVELGRQHSEPTTLQFERGTAVDDASVAQRERNLAGYFAAAVIGVCSRCLAVTVATYPDGRRLTWPALDHHDRCRDVSVETAVKVPDQRSAPREREESGLTL